MNNYELKHNRLADENLVSKKVQTDLTEELQQLRNQMMSMEATLNTEKTIAESLRGTIKQLTEAMTGVVAIKPKSPGASKPRNKDDITAPARNLL